MSWIYCPIVLSWFACNLLDVLLIVYNRFRFIVKTIGTHSYFVLNKKTSILIRRPFFHFNNNIPPTPQYGRKSTP